MIDIMDGLHLAFGTSLTIKTGREGRVTAIHDIEKINNILGYVFLEITGGASEKDWGVFLFSIFWHM